MTTTVQTRSRTDHHRSIKRELTESADPAWVKNMISNLKPDQTGVLDSPLFVATAHGAFPEGAWRRVLLEFSGVVESFPRYMGAYLARTSFGKRPGGETPPLQERTPARAAATAGLPHARRGYAVTLRRAPSVRAGTWLIIL